MMGSMHAITYSYGESSLGSFLAAIDEEGVCAVLGDDRDELRCDLQAKFPDKNYGDSRSHGLWRYHQSANIAGSTGTEAGCSIREATASIRAGDFEQMHAE